MRAVPSVVVGQLVNSVCCPQTTTVTTSPCLTEYGSRYNFQGCMLHFSESPEGRWWCVFGDLARDVRAWPICTNVFRSEITFCFVRKKNDREKYQALTPQARSPETDHLRPSRLPPRIMCSVEHTPSKNAVATRAVWGEHSVAVISAVSKCMYIFFQHHKGTRSFLFVFPIP